MGLSQEQIAFGIATMNVESGFNSNAKNPHPKSTAYGLGQIIDDTWSYAVADYNNHFRGHGPKIYPYVSRDDADAQIKVMGAYIVRVWERAKELAGDSRLKNYHFMEAAYGIWHQGLGADIEDRINKKGKRIIGVKSYLDGDYKAEKGKIDIYLNDTYIEAHDTLDIREISSKAKKGHSNPSGTRKGAGKDSSSNAGETLQRDDGDYRVVYRIEADGSMRGFFIS
ncbi:MAG: hypothetical protein HY887_05090 [Deltaproteobacteria bacterium]|nr:hypothetical protein [Deltaproteobacteria bacterium]